MPLLCLNGHVVAVLCGSSAILMLYVYYLLISNPLCVTYNALTVEPPRGTEVQGVSGNRPVYPVYSMSPVWSSSPGCVGRCVVSLVPDWICAGRLCCLHYWTSGSVKPVDVQQAIVASHRLTVSLSLSPGGPSPPPLTN